MDRYLGVWGRDFLFSFHLTWRPGLVCVLACVLRNPQAQCALVHCLKNYRVPTLGSTRGLSHLFSTASSLLPRGRSITGVGDEM